MLPCPRAFALGCVLLVALHAGAVGTLWASGAAPESPEPRTVDRPADPATLLVAAAKNDAALPMRSDVEVTDPADGTTVGRAHVAADPTEGRARARVPVRRPSAPFDADAVYLTAWGRWEQEGSEWRYSGGSANAYRGTNARLFFPVPERAEEVRTTRHENGTVTVRLVDVRPSPGMLSFAGDGATLVYRIAFDDGIPYVAAAKAIPAPDGGLAVTVERRRGATVRRPDGLPPATLREAGDRLRTGVRLA